LTEAIDAVLAQAVPDGEDEFIAEAARRTLGGQRSGAVDPQR
jgi:hypothetical protein